MAKPIPTLRDLSAPNHFPAAFHRWVLERAEFQREQFKVLKGGRLDRFQKARLAVIYSFAAYLEGECDDVFDQRMVALAEISREAAAIDREAGKEVPSSSLGRVVFHPTSSQVQIAGSLGDAEHSPPPPPDHTLEEMVAAGIRDLIGKLRGQRAGLREESQRFDRERTELQRRLDAAQVDQQAAADLRATVAEQAEEIAELTATNEELVIYLGDRKPPRREKIQEGIYKTDSGKFQSRVRDEENGGTKWSKPVDSLDEARELRATVDADEEPSEADLEAALDAKEAELGRELGEADVEAVRRELAKSTATGEPVAEEVT